jgi:hypothetical protein
LQKLLFALVFSTIKYFCEHTITAAEPMLPSEEPYLTWKVANTSLSENEKN